MPFKRFFINEASTDRQTLNTITFYLIRDSSLERLFCMCLKENAVADLQKEHEQFLVRHSGDFPVFLTDFPRELKPFYMKLNPDNETV